MDVTTTQHLSVTMLSSFFIRDRRDEQSKIIEKAKVSFLPWFKKDLYKTFGTEQEWSRLEASDLPRGVRVSCLGQILDIDMHLGLSFRNKTHRGRNELPCHCPYVSMGMVILELNLSEQRCKTAFRD